MTSISQAVATLGRDSPLPVVVASDEYAALLLNWIGFIRELGITRFLIVAMDGALEARLAGQGLVVARSSFEGSASDFWLRRMLVWQYLIEIGVHIVQSDVDAIWLRDPIPALFANQRQDILCSQGTLHPADIAESWGFVLCTGLMSIRSGPPALRFFAAFVQRAEILLRTDDQEVMNHMLAETGIVWKLAGMKTEIHHLEDQAFHCYEEIIDGEDQALGITVGLLPHDLFPRLPTAAPGAYVKHVLRPENDSARIQELRDIGCWRLQD